MIELRKELDSGIPAGRADARKLRPIMDAEKEAFKISFKGITTIPITFFHELIHNADAALLHQERPTETIYLDHMPRAPRKADQKIAATAGREIVRRSSTWIIRKEAQPKPETGADGP